MLIAVLESMEKWFYAHHPDSMPTERVQMRAAIAKATTTGR